MAAIVFWIRKKLFFLGIVPKNFRLCYQNVVPHFIEESESFAMFRAFRTIQSWMPFQLPGGEPGRQREVSKQLFSDFLSIWSCQTFRQAT